MTSSTTKTLITITVAVLFIALPLSPLSVQNELLRRYIPGEVMSATNTKANFGVVGIALSFVVHKN